MLILFAITVLKMIHLIVAELVLNPLFTIAPFLLLLLLLLLRIVGNLLRFCCKSPN